MKKKLSLQEIHSYELDILKAYIRVCEDHGLRWYLAGGTLLGAIRHKGFIPWDDDVDLLMPRPDYDAFIRVAHEVENYGPYRAAAYELHNLAYPFAKIYDVRTSIHKLYDGDETEQNIWIDIMPMDGLPADDRENAAMFRKSLFLRKVLKIQYARLGEGKTKLKAAIKPVFKVLARPIGKERACAMIDRLCRTYTVDESDYIGCINFGYGPQERMPKKEYLETVQVTFEGLSCNAPGCWDFYLRSLYGDYMQLPPEEKRVAHSMDVWVETEDPRETADPVRTGSAEPAFGKGRLFYTQEIRTEDGYARTAGIKARDDIAQILRGMGGREILIDVPATDRISQSTVEKLTYHAGLMKTWDTALAEVSRGDTLIVQFPLVNHFMLGSVSLRKVRARGARVVLLIHDLDTLRIAKRADLSAREKLRLQLEEKDCLRMCDAMIVHNTEMKEKLLTLGFPAGKMISLGIFDYLIPDASLHAETGKDLPIVIAGTLRRHKAGYVYDLPEDVPFALYGVGFEGEERENLKYFGSFPSDELPGVMKGSFGLVWDGDTADTCSGAYGDYLRINNPHKTSLYLASGLPVIIWKDAALARFVEKNHCGIAVSSLQELRDVRSRLTEEEYLAMCRNALAVGRRLRRGACTRRAVGKL